MQELPPPPPHTHTHTYTHKPHYFLSFKHVSDEHRPLHPDSLLCWVWDLDLLYSIRQ